ncbi:MAG: transposase [Candidatus Dormibacteria bacterium]
MPALPPRAARLALRVRVSPAWLAVGLVAGGRLVYGGFAALFALTPPLRNGIGLMPLSASPLISPWQRFDAQFFQSIATHGYHVWGTAAFPPLYPLLEAGAGRLAGDALGGLLVSTVALFAALLLVTRLVEPLLGPAVARWSALLLQAGLNRSLADAGLGELRRMLGYKCRWYGAELVVADRFLPSSRTCSRCGMVRMHLDLGERTFRCGACGLAIDRDLNAAINLAGRDHPNVAGSAPETQNACPRGGQPGLSPARPVDAGTGIAPEPAGMTGGRRQLDVPSVRC